MDDVEERYGNSISLLEPFSNYRFKLISAKIVAARIGHRRSSCMATDLIPSSQLDTLT
jgi:hypothetical protein